MTSLPPNTESRDHPRTRGEYADGQKEKAISEGITPAHAGNTFRRRTYSRLVQDHPRTRGEYLEPLYMHYPLQGSPPHTRGILPIVMCGLLIYGITPAHAGNTLWRSAPYRRKWDHPRTRGEYLMSWMPILRRLGSPPHTRGIPAGVKPTKFKQRITPAHAGNT